MLKAKRIIRAGSVVALILLAVLLASLPKSAYAQNDGVAAYARNSAKADKNAAKQYRKALKKNMKAQRKAAKKAKRHHA